MNSLPESTQTFGFDSAAPGNTQSIIPDGIKNSMVFFFLPELHRFKARLSEVAAGRLPNLPRLLLLIFGFVGLAVTESVKADDPKPKVAFIAAVADYPGNAALYEATFNGERLAAGLKKLGFEVTTLFDFTRDDFEASYKKWCFDTAASDLALVYFCGHGGNYNLKSYLVPQGADIGSASDLESQGIAFEESILKPLSPENKPEQRLNLVVIDGFQKNPFFLGANSKDPHGLSYSGFVKPNVLGEGTVLILPLTPGDIVKREDSRVLVGVILSDLIREGVKLNDGLEALKKNFNTQTGKQAQSYSEISEIQGSYQFSKEAPAVNPKEIIPKPVKPSDDESRRYQSLRDAASKAQKEGNFVESISHFLKIHDDFPDYRNQARERIRGLLASGDLLRNPFKGRKLLDAREFDFMRLVNSGGDAGKGSEGLGLPEARRVLWETERFFDKEKAILWAAQDARLGEGSAMEALAKLYLDFDRNKEAFDMFTKASETLADPLESFLFLGRLHSLGLGCEKSFPKAREFYIRALNEVKGTITGLPLAAVQLGHLEVEEQYAKVPEARNFRAAVEYYQTALKLKEYSGAANLGQLYWSGFPGTELDQEKGISILIEGADTGLNSRCMWLLADLFNRGAFNSPPANARIDKAKAEQYAMIAADFGYPEAINYCETNTLAYSGAGRGLLPDETDYQWRKLREAQAAATEKRMTGGN